MKDIYDLLGRIFISLIFIYEILDTVFFFDNTVVTMKQYGITYYPKTLLIIGLFFIILGAAMVLIGYFSRLGAFFLLIYWLTYTVTVYSFWNDPPEYQRLSALYFMRNVAVCGGLLMIMANSSGKYSVKRLIHTLRLPK